MNSRTIACTLTVFSILCCRGLAQTPTTADIDALRAQIDGLKTDYEKRIQALEMQLQALKTQLQPAANSETQAAPTPAPEPQAQQPQAQQPTVQVPSGAQGAGGPTGQLPVYGGTESSKVFNPDIAVIGDFIGAFGSNKVNPDPAF